MPKDWRNYEGRQRQENPYSEKGADKPAAKKGRAASKDKQGKKEKGK